MSSINLDLISNKLKKCYNNSSFNIYYQNSIEEDLKGLDKDNLGNKEDLENRIKNNIFPTFCAGVIFQGFVLTPAYFGIRNAFQQDFKEAAIYSVAYLSSRFLIKKLKTSFSN